MGSSPRVSSNIVSSNIATEEASVRNLINPGASLPALRRLGAGRKEAHRLWLPRFSSVTWMGKSAFRGSVVICRSEYRRDIVIEACRPLQKKLAEQCKHLFEYLTVPSIHTNQICHELDCITSTAKYVKSALLFMQTHRSYNYNAVGPLIIGQMMSCKEESQVLTPEISLRPSRNSLTPCAKPRPTPICTT